MDILRDNEHGRSGLAQLRAMIELGGRPPIGQTLGFTLVEADEGRVVFEGQPDERSLNPIGSVHGGYAAAVLDSCCGCATHTRLAATQGYTTMELKVAYHRALKPGTRVRAEGLVLSFGRRAAFTEAKLYDEQERLCASATSTLLVFDL
ncbi:PaaI family thioesterase [Aureimonas mangrovi]|uniref:PaaI family thioesterase n=1 Tax=Aureimonas mangrovi TaxID=2758041 RepID=UPI001FECDFB9|nr:PaaI family thioesterase [Aureimonas mangrovi]